MAKKEVKTDEFVRNLLKDANIHYTEQWSDIKEINEALKTASKKWTWNVWFPEYTAVVHDFLLVIEDKSDLNKHIKKENDLISQKTEDVCNYAVNWALFYAKHLAKNTNFRKILAFWISWDEKRHIISPIYVDETEYYRELPDVETFLNFSEKNIEEYYVSEILWEKTDIEKDLEELLADAKELHEDLRNYWNMRDAEKPLVVSWILLALREKEAKNFSIDMLSWDKTKTDWQKIYDAISDNLQRVNVAPEVKRDKILSQFSFIKDTPILSEINKELWKTPLKHFTEFLDTRIYKSIKYAKSAEDYIWRFYWEFMSYSWWDWQTLWIVLTPKHITQLFCDLADLKKNDVVFDPCCWTWWFLIAAMHNMLSLTDDETERRSIKQKQVHWIELRPDMFTVATTNMILRWDGKSNLINEDFFKPELSKLQLKWATVWMMNPPYSQGSKKNPMLYEINFTEHLLDSLTPWARAIVIVPQSSMTWKSAEEQNIKNSIYKNHTLEWVITLNKDTFYGVWVLPCIAVFTAHQPHPKNKICKFINFEDDWFKVAPHVWLVETEQAKDKKQHLLDVRYDRIEAPSKFCVKTRVEPEDERLHSFYYFNDEIPTEEDFDKTIWDYLTFEFSMIMQDREYLFNKDENDEK